MKTNFCLLTIMLSVTFLSCKKENDNPTAVAAPVKTFDQLKKAESLLGAWGSTSTEGTLTETWSKMNDSVFAGHTYFVAGKDTVFSESIQLEERSQKLYYTPTVSNQNEGKAVSFALTSSSETELVFENPNHDFPQKIVYNLIGKDSLIAVISGKKNGKEAKESFPMKKIK